VHIALPNHLRPRREKIFGPALSHPLDGNGKARLWAAAGAYNAANKTPHQHQGPLTWATLRVLRVLLWRFHSADGTGRCFPSYETIAAAARCHRDSVYVALRALEEAGLLTWVNRITRIRHRVRDLLGEWRMDWQTIRTSNSYQFVDPLHRRPGRNSYKSDFPPGPQNQDSTRPIPVGNFHQRGGARLDAARVTQDLLGETSSGTALGQWSSAAEAAAGLLRNPRAPT
jgi:hypothetical protein